VHLKFEKTVFFYFFKLIKGLGEYLEKKRLFFPRFFFLSNDELLEILAETRDPTRVEPHLKKCFEGIRKLMFDEKKHIQAIISAECEQVNLVSEVVPDDANGLVEVWLYKVENLMKLTLKSEASKAINDYHEMSRLNWIAKYPGQIIVATSIIYWTSEVTSVIY
jgi:dynein heavy chain